jgi:1-acyl-sn-glycerol-3-phosphate acyltransferase
MSARLQDRDFWYDALRCYANVCTLRSYRRHQYVGEKDAPWNRGAIFASNHTNTLMDPLVILAGNRHAQIWMARGDIFKKPFIAKLLHFLKIIPIFRVRDGIREVSKDNELISETAALLKDNVNFCIFPEGRHRPMHSLLPIGKGVSRIAFEASERFGAEKHILVEPVGVEYEDFFRYRSTFCVEYGEPLDVTEFLQCHAELGDAEKHILLRNELHEALAKLITYIPDDEDYDAVWELVKLRSEDARGSLQERKTFRRAQAAEIAALKADKPEEYRSLVDKAAGFRAQRLASHISLRSASVRTSALRAALKWVLLVLTSPLFALASVLYSPILLFVRKKLKGLKDKAFSNTVRFAVPFAASWLLFVIYAVLLFMFTPWWVALTGLAFIYFGRTVFFYDWLELARVAASDVRWLRNGSLRKLRQELL